MISKPGEITWITQATGKLTLTGGDVPGLVNDLVDDGVAVLDASVAHMPRLATRPARHRDPFDRLLVAHALVEGLTVVSADPQVPAFDVPTLEARR